ncbi:class I SAM-dependent methyltransferase [Fodinisporobacter ferrooxydans]|uniref:Class I SAM-dependent methyltransferase n=1 Tax=Fodinisporobacter ferrooxydans TaxID=2901836 RepID=A0ABY4CSJ6_9BACL|nr:class I SAM-dependent methyltransferase [Alicyclobacillaceae bacterium MYW30-H2]
MGHRFNPKHVHKLTSPERQKLLPPEEILQSLEIGLQDDIADIGCGPGYFAIPAARMTRGTVYGVDVEPEMLRILQDNMREADISNIQTVESDMEHIQLPDHCVNKLLCSFVLHEVGDMDQAIREFQRILRPNGKILVIEWEKKEMESGPPLEERLEASELEQKLQAFDFQTRLVRPNDKQYMIIAE